MWLKKYLTLKLIEVGFLIDDARPNRDFELPSRVILDYVFMTLQY